MIKKIGLSTFNEDNINNFGYRNYNETLKLDKSMKPLSKIHNIIVDKEVITQKVIDKIVVISIALDVKIIYTSLRDETLYVFEKKLIKSLKVKISNRISTDVIEKIENNFIKPEIYIYDINGIIQCENSLNLSIFISGAFKNLNNHNILLLISLENIKTNIFELEINTNELLQKTFYQDENIVTATCEKDIFYIKEKSDEYFLCEIINNEESEIPLPYNLENPLKVNKSLANTYIITWQNYDKYIISKLENGKLITLFTKAKNSRGLLPIYNSLTNKVLYIKENSENLKLMYTEILNNCENIDFINSQIDNYNKNLESYSPQNNFEIKSKFEIECNPKEISSCSRFKEYNLSSFGNYIAYSLEDENADKLYVFSIERNTTMQIEVPVRKYYIKNIRFSSDEKYLLLIVGALNCENIYIYNILDENLLKVTRNIGETTISSFYINYINNCIYVSQNDIYDFNIYIISLNNFEIKEIINLNASEIEIITQS